METKIKNVMPSLFEMPIEEINKLNIVNPGDIKKMVNNEIPTYIYGAGITASKVFNYINKLGVNVSGFVVDKKNIDSLYNLPVFDFNQIEQVPINVILGYVPTDETVQEVYNKVLEKHKFINFKHQMKKII